MLLKARGHHAVYSHVACLRQTKLRFRILKYNIFKERVFVFDSCFTRDNNKSVAIIANQVFCGQYSIKPVVIILFSQENVITSINPKCQYNILSLPIASHLEVKYL